VKKIDPDCLRAISVIRIGAELAVDIVEFGVQRAQLGEVQVAWGNFQLADQIGVVVATRESGGVDKISIAYVTKPLELGPSRRRKTKKQL
jgi:hypothetical protein